MKPEEFPHHETEFDKLLKIKEAEGWHFVGRENLTRTKFSKEATFEEIPFQSEDDLRKKYLRLAKQGDPSSEFEVDLVLDEDTEKLRRFREIGTSEEYKKILSMLKEEDRVYYIFMRRVAK